MDYNLQCNYCGHKWTEFFMNQRSLDHSKCDICKDTGLTVREARSEKVDYYVGCPPFPPKKSKTEDKTNEFLQDAVFAALYPDETW